MHPIHSKSLMRVIHVVECFASGTAHFINLLTRYTYNCDHIVIHGERIEEMKAELVKARFPEGTKFIYWEDAQREIKLKKDFQALNSLIRLLRNVNADVIHLHSSKAGFLGRLACFILGFKNVIYTPNGAAFAREDISKKKKKLYIALEKVADKLSGHVVCCSSSEAMIFNDNGIKANYINNGTSIPDIQTLVDGKFKHEANPFTIVTCGRVTEQKNPALFNKIAGAFAASPNIRFIWIGEGDASQINQLDSGNILLTGWQSKENVLQALLNADLYLSTALWEGLPFSVLEALSLGKCLLLSDCVGNVDLVKDGYNGFKYGSAEEAVSRIEWLINNQESLQTMAKNSREWCERDFDVQVVFRKYQALYESLVEKQLLTIS